MRKTIIAVVMCLLWGALAGWSQTIGVPVEGKVTEEGKPLPDVQVVLTNQDTGKTYKTKTDKGGGFNFLGMTYGNFLVEVVGGKGEKLFSNKTAISADNTTSSNILRIDIPKGGAAASPEPTAPKLTKEQLAKIEADNKKIAGLNSLINDSQNARQAQDWPKAENALKQLIAAAPETSRWDFYLFLGEAQVRQNKLQDAVQTYDKGIQVAQPVAAGSIPADQKIPALNAPAAKAGIGRMLTSQGNAYLKLQKQDEGVAALKQAAAIDPSSAMAAYNLCGVAYTVQKYDDAKTACNKYLQLEPAGPHAEEVKAFMAQMGAK